MAVASRSVPFPTLHAPDHDVIDSGIVRLGDGVISDDFPVLHVPDQDVIDPGTVRLGDGVISDDFPTGK